MWVWRLRQPLWGGAGPRGPFSWGRDFLGDATHDEQGLEKAELLSTGAARRTGAAYKRACFVRSGGRVWERNEEGGSEAQI